MVPLRYRPDSAFQRRLYIAASAVAAIAGVVVLAGALDNLQHSMFLGIVLLVVGALNIATASAYFPLGFTLPADVSRNDRRAVVDAVRQYRRERRANR